MPVTNDFIKTALKVTGHFEDSEDPFGGVSGDFDGMGISLGVLQWNIGSGSLQPLVKAAGKSAVLNAMPVYGNELWKACNVSIDKGLGIVRSWQNGSHLQNPIRKELKVFVHSQEFIDQQILKANAVANISWDAASDWNLQTSGNAPSLHEFCWFFDLMTQNGGLKGITPADVDNFIKLVGYGAVDDLICDWLENRPSSVSGFKDASKNAQLWRNNVSASQLNLFVTSYLLSQKSNPKWRVDTLNRKATIALKHGWVHGEKQDLSALI